MTATYTPLANVTLGAAASSVTFSSIPATYRDLILVIDTTTSVTTGLVQLELNASTSDYSFVYMSGNGSTTASGASTGNTFMRLNLPARTNATMSNFIVNLLDASATNKHKTVISRFNNASTGTEAFANRWGNTAAITSTRVFLPSGNFNSGSTFALYGIAS
jgi:hypothetical protein